MNTILSYHQKELLDLVFFGEALQRDKFACVIANGIDPLRKATEYLDSGSYENEIKQILDYTDFSIDLPQNGILHVGGHGLILIAPDFEDYEFILTEFCFLRSIQIFFTNYFSRIYSIEDDLRDIRHILIDEIHRDPRSIAEARTRISYASLQCVLLKEILGYLDESLKENLLQWNLYESQFTPHQQEIAERFQILSTLHFSIDRINDTKDIIAGVNNEIEGSAGPGNSRVGKTPAVDFYPNQGQLGNSTQDPAGCRAAVRFDASAPAYFIRHPRILAHYISFRGIFLADSTP